MKKKIFKYTKYCLPLLSAAIIPTITSSCSYSLTTNAKVITASSWNKDSTKYSSLSTSSVNLQSAIYGSNYNKGNYIFIYGSLTDSAFYSALYGTNIIKPTQQTDQNFNSDLLKNIFNANSSIQSSFNFSVSVLMFIDIPPYNGDASDLNGLTGYDSPTATYSSDEVLKEYNNGGSTYTVATLPLEAQIKIGSYKRTDKSAIIYRDLINYIQKARPNISSPSSGGVIAFKKGKSPKSLSLTASLKDVIDYYTPSSTD